jgi:predicted ATPase
MKKQIILTGAQGTGKTTLMYELVGDGTKTISQVDRRVAKENGWGLSENTTTDCQKGIYTAIKNELLTDDNYVSDRGLTCVAAYTMSKVFDGTIPRDVLDEQIMDIIRFHHTNPDILVVYVPIEFPIVADGVRSIDSDYQRRIDYYIQNILQTAQIPYITVTGTVEERKQQIEEKLKKMGLFDTI